MSIKSAKLLLYVLLFVSIFHVDSDVCIAGGGGGGGGTIEIFCGMSVHLYILSHLDVSQRLEVYMTYYCVDYSELLIESLSVCAQVGYCHSYLSAGQ